MASVNDGSGNGDADAVGDCPGVGDLVNELALNGNLLGPS